MQETKNGGGFSLIRSVLAACCGLILCGILLLVGAALICRETLPEAALAPVCWGAVAVCGLLAAFLAAGNCDHRIAASLCACVVFFAAALLIGELLGGGISLRRATTMGGILLADAFVGAVLSGLVRR